jgi:hypothetical protein
LTGGVTNSEPVRITTRRIPGAVVPCLRRASTGAADDAVRFRRLRASATLALVALIGVIGAGCSNGSAENGDTGAASSTGTSGDKKAADRDQAVKFSECMRQNGVSDFPDPNASGEFVYGASVTPEVFTKATDACKDLQPPGSLSAKRGPEQQKQGLKFAQCMRENGVKDFPDPVNGEPLINTYRIPSSERKGGMTILNAAIEKCRDLLAKAAAGQ